jgi:transcriptional regulator with XRE-family HTH domain
MIGEEVRRRRERLGLTGAQLAGRAGLAPSAVSQIETGKRTPNSASVIKLATALGTGVGDLYPKGQAPLPDFDDARRREPKPPAPPGHGPYRWTQDKTTEELQQIALEEAQFAKPQTYEELLKGHKENKKAQLKVAHRRTMAYANIANINEELGRRGARSPVELAIKQFNDAMSAPEEAPQEPREKQEGQRAG